jgi:hypothetical protein
MRCTRCNRKLKTGGYNGSSYGRVCYALLFDTERKPAKKSWHSMFDGREDYYHDGQADMFLTVCVTDDGAEKQDG